MSLFQRIPDPANQAHTYPPLFHFLGDYSHAARTHQKRDQRGVPESHLDNWSPRFDVHETSTAYELHGDLPGIDRDDIHVEFTGEDTLSITGHKERRYSTQVNDPSTQQPNTAGTKSQQQPPTTTTTTSIDMATTLSPTRRRTSIVNAQTRQPPRENIDMATTLAPTPGTRRPSLINAQTWQPPTSDIDAWTHSQLYTSKQRNRNRRPSIVDAQSWKQPAETIDAWTHAPRAAERRTRRPSIIDAHAWRQPAENIDAATTGPARRGGKPVAASASRPSRAAVPQPWLVTERPCGTFSRAFRFPAAVRREGLEVGLKDGVLTVVVRKRVAA